MEELAIAMKEGFQKINNQISALGGRWGIKNETTFRNTISALFSKAGYSVSRGYYGDRELDIVIKNGEHILLEITSAALKKMSEVSFSLLMIIIMFQIVFSLKS